MTRARQPAERTIRWTLAVAGVLLAAGSLGLEAAAEGGPKAGSPYVIDAWSTDKGLPQSTVTSIIQTRDGYLWFGTLNGLVRFDGNRFTVFDQYNTPDLNSSRILKLFEDSQGALWVGTETAGVALIKDGQVLNPPIGQSGPERLLAAICEDARNAVWLYNANGELWRWWQGQATPFLFNLDRPDSGRAIIAETSGPVWIGSDRHLAAIGPIPATATFALPLEQDVPVRKLDFLFASKKGGYWRLADGRVQKWRGSRLERDWGPYLWGAGPSTVTAVCEDPAGNPVIGTKGVGLYWYGSDGKTTWFNKERGLTHDVILSLCLDADGNLWVGTDGGGLNRVRRDANRQNFTVLDKTTGQTVQSVSEDAAGRLWIGINSRGVWCYQGGDLQGMPGRLDPAVRAVFVDRDQHVWVGTARSGLFELDNGLFRPAPGSEAVPKVINAIHQDRAGRLWVGGQGGLACWRDSVWTNFTAGDGLSADDVRAIADDHEGRLWIGTWGGGLNCLKDGRFTAFHKKDGLPGEDISSLYVDREGVLWIGTLGSGLGRYQDGTWARYTTRDGLFSNGIGYVLEDDQGCLWIGSNAGLMRVPKRELTAFAHGQISVIPCRTYGELDGLPTRECTQGSQPVACRSRDGTLWLPTVKGLVSVRPGPFSSNPHPPPVMIESVSIDGQPQTTNALRPDLPAVVVVPAGKERVEISYTSINLAAPGKGQFKYWLDGYEKQWTDAGNDRVARYTKLVPGRYRFQVKACNEDGVWNETGSTLALLVLTPYWRTGWFLGMTAMLLLGTMVAVVHYLSTQRLQRQLERMRHQEALEKERARIAQDIHDQLGASLTQVALLGELVEGDKENPREVEAHAQQISLTARETTRILDEIVWAVNPSNDTLDGLMTYLCKYAQDYLAIAGLRYRLDIPDQLPGVVVPPEFRHNVFLAFKEAVTNIVRHAAASTVWVRLRLEPATFVLEIEDNGKGLANLDEKAARTRNGLRGMRKRMESLGGGFDVLPAPNGGTIVRFTAPLAHPTGCRRCCPPDQPRPRQA